jgi:hypothetical protein
VERREEEIVKQIPVKRYMLTEAGEKFYVKKEMVSGGPGGAPLTHHGDFCAGKLSLDKVIAWDKPVKTAGHLETTLTYTYRIAPASWALDPDLQQVFPMVARVVNGEHTLELKQRFRQSGKSWVAVPAWQ